MSRVIELAKKLKALAEDGRGNANEEGNAARLLEKYMKDHGLSMSDIDEEVECEFYYIARTPAEERIFIQVFFSVMDYAGKIYNMNPYVARSMGAAKGDIVLQYYCPHYMDGLIVEKMRFFWAHFQIEEKNFWDKVQLESKVLCSAFVTANDLFSPNNDPEKRKAKKRKEMSWDELQALQRMANRMEKKTMHKRLQG